MKELHEEPFGRLVVLTTLRSDFLGSFQIHPQLVDLSFDDFKLGPMGVEGYTQVIEGPASLSGLELEPGLSRWMMASRSPPARSGWRA